MVSMKRCKIDISDVFLNDGQIDGLPKNPRTISKARLDRLCKSILSLPEMTEAREIMSILTRMVMWLSAAICACVPTSHSLYKGRKDGKELFFRYRDNDGRGNHNR